MKCFGLFPPPLAGEVAHTKCATEGGASSRGAVGGRLEKLRNEIYRDVTRRP
jgi:hypothetical protein